MNFDDMLITLKNKKQYIVVEHIEYDGKVYLYLVNPDNQLDSVFKEMDMNQKDKLMEIDQKLFKEKIYPMFLEKIKHY